MKIGIISSTPKNTGGYVRGGYLVKALRAQGHDVEYLTPQPRMPFKTEHLIFPLINIFRYSFRKFDYLFVLKPFPVGTIPAILNRLFTGSKIVVDIDDLDSSYFEGPIGKFTEAIQKPFPKFFDFVTILDNDNLIEHVTKKWKVSKEKFIVIEQGVDTELFNPSKYKKKKKSDKKIFMFTGHLGDTAIIEVSALLEMFKKLSEKHSNSKLMIVGGGPRIEMFKKKAKNLKLDNYISFTGYIKSSKIVRYLAQADVCLCYHAERYSNYFRNSMKIREYLSMGKLVVCTDIGDLKKFQKNTIQTTSDKKNFLEGMIAAYNKKESKKKSTKRRNFIKQNFSWEKIARKISQRLKNDN